MNTLWQDLRFSLRLLGKDRSFTITALLTLAVCIGANTAMFGIVRSVLLKPLPFQDSDRVVLLYNSYPAAGAPRVGASVPNLYDRLEAVPAMDVQALFRTEGTTFGDANGAERLKSLRATPSFYRITHAQPLFGRVFTEADGEPGQNAKALLSYGFWQRKFGGEPSVVGTSMRLNGAPVEIIGVLPADFTFLQNDTDVYTPTAFTPEDRRQPAAQQQLADDRHARRRGAPRRRPSSKSTPSTSAERDPVSAAHQHPARCGVLHVGRRTAVGGDRRRAAGADAALGRRVVRAADRLPQHRESRAGAGERPRARDGDAPRDWRRLAAAGAATADGDDAAVGGRRRAWPGARLVGAATRARARSRRDAARPRNRTRPGERIGSCLAWPSPLDCARPDAGGAFVADEHQQRAARGRPRRHGRAQHQSDPPGAGHRADHHRAHRC